MQNLKALTGQTAVWASALCEGDDLVARADSETVSVLSKGVDSDLGTYSFQSRPESDTAVPGTESNAVAVHRKSV